MSPVASQPILLLAYAGLVKRSFWLRTVRVRNSGVSVPKRDIMLLIQLLNLLQGLAALLGPEEFKRRFPEFVVATRKVKARIRSELRAKRG